MLRRSIRHEISALRVKCTKTLRTDLYFQSFFYSHFTRFVRHVKSITVYLFHPLLSLSERAPRPLVPPLPECRNVLLEPVFNEVETTRRSQFEHNKNMNYFKFPHFEKLEPNELTDATRMCSKSAIKFINECTYCSIITNFPL